MSFQTTVLTRLANITSTLNQILTTAKRIFELPAQTTLVPSSKIHVDNEGVSEYLTAQQIIDSAVDSVGFVNSPIEPPDYADIAAMIANQENQTPNFIQYVIDAGDDPNVDPEDPNQSRYYRYWGTTNGTLADYQLLSNTQVAVILTSPSYRQFEVKDIVEALPVNPGIGNVYLEKDVSDRITGVLFDSVFSNYLLKYKEIFDAPTTMYVKLFNKTQQKTLIASVTDFYYSDISNTYFVISMDIGNTTSDVSVGDKVEVYFDIDVVGEDVDLSLYQLKSEKGAANGYAGLDGSGKVPSAQLPSYVDDVLEFADLASFPVTGETGKIYVAQDTNFSYRWTGTVYVRLDELSAASIKTLYESNANTNAFTDALFAKLNALSLTKHHEFACSDETSNLAIGTVYQQRLLRAFTNCTAFDFGVITAPTGSTIIIDVQKNGTTVFSTKATIDVGEFTTLTAATPQVITGGFVSFAAGDILKVVIDQVGSTVAGVNLKCQITYNT